MGRSEQLNTAFAELAETLVGAFDLAEALDRILGWCLEACGAAGAGILVKDGNGTLRDIAYTDDRVRRLEQLQVRSGEGPCVDCVRLGQPVMAADLVASSQRWPRFAEAATASGFLAVRAVPLRFHGRSIGTLNLFSHDGSACSDDGLPVAQALADMATLAVAQHTHADGSAAAHITRALAARSAIEQARGMLAQDGDLSVDEALHALRAHAARTGAGISRLAADLVCGRTTTGEVLGTSPPVR